VAAGLLAETLQQRLRALQAPEKGEPGPVILPPDTARGERHARLPLDEDARPVQTKEKETL